MSRFPFSFPSDIVSEIFFHLGQEDCIQCMRVCRQWHSEIPNYTTECWQRIVISPRNLNKVNDCMMRCLGPHTQDVTIIEMSTVIPILNKLKELNCVLRAIDINCEVNDDSELLLTVKQFSDTLKGLFIYNYGSELSVPQLLDYFPNLIDLALEFNHDLCAYLSKPVEADTYSGYNLSGLKSLRLDGSLHFEDRIVPILRCCPNLRVLDFKPTLYGSLPTDFLDQIYQLCPKIAYFKWNTATEPPSEYRKVLADSSESALQTFIYRGDINALHSFQHIFEKSKHTLKYLTLISQFFEVANGSRTLPQLRFPRVKILSLVDIDMSAAEWLSFLDGFEDIQSLSLYYSRDSLSLNRLAEIISQRKNLQHVNFVRLDTITGLVDVWDNIGILSNNSQLQSLDLGFVHLADSGLLDLCEIRSLKKLYLWVSCESDISLQGLLVFADKLKDVDHGIEKLELGHFKLLDDSVLERLARARSLSWISVVSSDLITAAGVKAFICYNGNRNVPRNVRTLSCKYITQVEWSENNFS